MILDLYILTTLQALGFAKNEAKKTRILIPGKLYKKLWNSEFFIVRNLLAMGTRIKTLPGLTGVLFAVKWRMRSVSVVFVREEPNVNTGDVDLLLWNILIRGINLLRIKRSVCFRKSKDKKFGSLI